MIGWRLFQGLTHEEDFLLCFVATGEADEPESMERGCKRGYGMARGMPFDFTLKSSFKNNI